MSRALHKGLTLLSLVAEGHGTLAELSRASGLPKSTVHRLTGVLAEQRLLRYEARRFELDYRLLELSEKARRRLDYFSVARPHLYEMSRRTGETVHLGVLRDGHIIYLDKIEGQRGLQMRSYVGLRSPARTTALGKVLIAHRPRKEWGDHLHAAPPPSDRRLPDPPTLVGELARVREQGVAVDLEENEPGTRCIAAPVWEASGQVIAAVSISGASLYLTEARLRELDPILRRCTQAISRQLGGGGAPLLEDGADAFEEEEAR